MATARSLLALNIPAARSPIALNMLTARSPLDLNSLAARSPLAGVIFPLALSFALALSSLSNNIFAARSPLAPNSLTARSPLAQPGHQHFNRSLAGSQDLPLARVVFRSLFAPGSGFGSDGTALVITYFLLKCGNVKIRKAATEPPQQPQKHPGV